MSTLHVQPSNAAGQLRLQECCAVPDRLVALLVARIVESCALSQECVAPADWESTSDREARMRQIRVQGIAATSAGPLDVIELDM